MRNIVLGVLGVILFGMVSSGCGGSEAATFPEQSFAVVVSSDVGIGSTRLLVGIADAEGSRLGSPEHAVTLAAAPLDDMDSEMRGKGTFVWIVPDVSGVYRADFDFDRPGIWQVTVIPESGGPFDTVPFTVREDTAAPGVGDAAPAAPTPTLGELPIEALTTDDDPDPRFYEMSLAEAMLSGRDTVLVFSTPAYCRTSACGPLLDIAKEVARDHPDVNFLHVEVYTGFTEPGFSPDIGHLAPAVTAAYWNLPSEPWVFVINDAGIVTARFDGVIDGAELAAAIG